MGHSTKVEAALALHRFGMGPRPGSIVAIQSDPRGALLAEGQKSRSGAANLSGADLTRAALADADVTGVNLSHAKLIGAELRGAKLLRANLFRADLTECNLCCALNYANLSYANLIGANIFPEQWNKAKSLKGATMPDGSIHP